MKILIKAQWYTPQPPPQKKTWVSVKERSVYAQWQAHHGGVQANAGVNIYPGRLCTYIYIYTQHNTYKFLSLFHMHLRDGDRFLLVSATFTVAVRV